MRVVVAPDKFKGSCSARTVAIALAEGVRDVVPGAEAALVPMADGGEGTVATFLDAGAEARTVVVEGPLGDPVEATFALDGKTAVLEMAAASGLVLVPPERLDPRRASTYGTGQLIAAALDAGATVIVIGIGGSATNDGGAGMLQALGVRLTDARGRELPRGAAALGALQNIDLTQLDARLAGARLHVACDVDNPLTGPRGASAIFGPQKGADPPAVAELDALLGRLADAVADTLGADRRDEAGAGAAGGLGFGLHAVLGADLRPGIDVIAEARGLAEALRGADLCLTGEGRIDEQTLGGKTADGVARYAAAEGIAVFAFGGSVDPHVEAALAARSVVCVPITDGPMDLNEAMRRAPELLRAASARAMRLWLAGPGRRPET